MATSKAFRSGVTVSGSSSKENEITAESATITVHVTLSLLSRKTCYCLLPYLNHSGNAAVFFMWLTLVCWTLVVMGFGFGISQDKDKNAYADQGINEKDEPPSYPLWTVCFIGPLVIASAYMHAALRNSTVGSITAFFSVIFLTALGMILLINGDRIRVYNEYIEDNVNISDADKNHHEPPWWIIMEFSGAITATFSWTIVMILWHFYERESQEQ